MPRIVINCKEQLVDLKFQICKDNETLVRQTVSIATLAELFLLQNKSGKIFTIDQVCRVTLYWNGAIHIISLRQCVGYAFLISTDNRITFEDFQAKAIIANSRSVHLSGKVSIRHFLFQYCLFNRERKTDKVVAQNQYREEQQNLIFGRVKIAQHSEVKIQQLKLLKSDLIIDQKARLLLYSQNKHIFDLSKNSLKIYPRGKIVSHKPLIIIANYLENWGFIYSNQKGLILSSITIISKNFINHGLVKHPFLAIRSQCLQNTDKGNIEYQKGTLFIQYRLQNNGKIQGQTLMVKGLPKRPASLINYGQISCKKMVINANYLKNHKIMTGMDIRIMGTSQDKGLLSNRGQIVPLQNLLIKDLIFEMTSQGSIVSNGDLTVDLEICLNSGDIRGNKQSLFSVKDVICNRGTLVLNSGSYINAGLLNNHNKMKIGTGSKVQIKDLFYNTGQVQLQNATVIARNLLSHGSLDLLGSNIISGQFISVDQINTDILKLDCLCLDINGKGLVANQTVIEAKHIKNKGSIFQVGQLSMKGNLWLNLAITFDNQSKFVILDSGQISLVTEIFDSESSLTCLNNVKLKTQGSMSTQGKIYLQNVIFEGVKYFSNNNEVSITNGDYKFNSFNHNKLSLNNVHITTDLYDGREVHCEGGSVGIHQRERTSHISAEVNQFVLSVKGQQFAKSVKIYLHDAHSFKKAITSDLNGYYFLESPLIYGDFIKNFYAKHFDLPGNNYENYIHKNRTTFGNMIKLQNKKEHNFPKNNQKALNIQIEEEFKFRGDIKYKGNLSLRSKQIEIFDGKVLAEDGLLRLSAGEGLKMIQCYVQAKGIQLQAHRIEDEGGRYLAGLQGIAIRAGQVTSKPIVTLHNQTFSSGDSETIRRFEKAKESMFQSQGDIVVQADQLIHMISPKLYSKSDITISADNIMIHGMFLLNEKTTTVKKDTFWGGQKTNTYYARNDKPLPAEITAQNIYLKGKQAALNATIKGKKLYDLTEKGVRLFFVIGYKGSSQNRQFGNALTQGYQGHSHTRQKLLKANLKKLQELYRPPQLGGFMIFDTVDWDIKKTKVIGEFKQNIYKCKSWYESWHQQSLSAGVSIVIGIAASFVGANVIAPYFTQGLSLWQAAMVKAGFSALTQRFAISIAVNGGNLDKAMQEFMSINTVRALAFNIAAAGVSRWLCDKLEIQSTRQIGSIFKVATIRHATSITLDKLINNNFPTNLKELVMPFVADVFGQFTANKIGEKYRLRQIEYLTHKALHGISGCLIGLIESGSWKGAVSGALSAAFAEIALEAMIPDSEMDKKASDIISGISNGKSFDINDLERSIQLELALAKIVGTVIGGVVTGDWTTAKAASSNAVENNGKIFFLAQLFNLWEKIITKVAEWVDQKYQKWFFTQQQRQNIKNVKQLIELFKGSIKEFSKFKQMFKNPNKFSKQALDDFKKHKKTIDPTNPQSYQIIKKPSNILKILQDPSRLQQKIKGIKYDESFIYALGSSYAQYKKNLDTHVIFFSLAFGWQITKELFKQKPQVKGPRQVVLKLPDESQDYKRHRASVQHLQKLYQSFNPLR